MIMYKTTPTGVQITKINIIKETDASFWSRDDGMRFVIHPKTTTGTDYWVTWNDARDHLINRALDKKISLYDQIERLNAEIDTLIDMVEG